MADLRVTLVQAELLWEDCVGNLHFFSQLLEPLAGTTDVVILPEMFTTGFSLNGEVLAETMTGPTVRWLQQLANNVDAAICGSVIIRQQSALYNRFIWVTPAGEIYHYDKHHLFRYAQENSVYSPGSEKLVIDYKGWKIRPFVCYDLRFPVWCANVNKAYDLGIYVANWPAARAAHWKALLLARAIENQVYIAGVNRIGRDGNNLEYAGDSMLLDPQGRIMQQCGAKEQCTTSVISHSELEEYRNRFPAWMDSI